MPVVSLKPLWVVYRDPLATILPVRPPNQDGICIPIRDDARANIKLRHTPPLSFKPASAASPEDAMNTAIRHSVSLIPVLSVSSAPPFDSMMAVDQDLRLAFSAA